MLQSFDFKHRITSRKNVILQKYKHFTIEKMFKIFVTNMKSGHVVEFSYKTKRSAHNKFVSVCNELSYNYTEVKSMNVVIAGGIGHDFRLELVEVK
jgi:hypothetical protein